MLFPGADPSGGGLRVYAKTIRGSEQALRRKIEACHKESTGRLRATYDFILDNWDAIIDPLSPMPDVKEK
jgi:hypothetical protein